MPFGIAYATIELFIKHSGYIFRLLKEESIAYSNFQHASSGHIFRLLKEESIAYSNFQHAN